MLNIMQQDFSGRYQELQQCCEIYECFEVILTCFEDSLPCLFEDFSRSPQLSFGLAVSGAGVSRGVFT